MRTKGIAIVILLAATMIGCNNAPVSVDGNSEVTIESIVATPRVVGAGETALIKVTATSTLTTDLEYDWSADGAYEYLQPMGPQCVFASPSCHYGPATVRVTVSDGEGSASASVYLNEPGTPE